jgi:hypothetical protein
MRLIVASCALVLGLVACASDPAFTRLGDGHYRVQCSHRLLQCLEPAAKACSASGYEIVNAEERREVAGPEPLQTEVLKSVAEVRCRQARSLFGGDSEPSARPASSASAPAPASAAPAIAPVATATAPRCVPGTSLACGAVTGCSGAQICAADGASFGPCECAPPSPSAVTPDGGEPLR